MGSVRRCVGVRSISILLVLGAWIQFGESAEVQYPLSIAVSESGTIFFADRDLPGVWKLEGGNLSVFFEGSKKFRTPLNAVRCVAVDAEGKLWAGDSSTRDVYRVAGPGQVTGLTQKASAQDAAGKTDAAKPAQPRVIHGDIGIPMDIAFAKDGDLFVSDLELHRIVRVAKDGGSVQQFVAIEAPRGLCLDNQENLWVVSGRRLVKVTEKGEKTTVVENGTFEFPHTVAVAADQTAYVCDGYAKAIWKVPPGGKPEKLLSGEPFVNPVGMRLVKDKLLVVDPRAKAMFEVSLDKKVTTVPLKTNQP